MRSEETAMTVEGSRQAGMTLIEVTIATAVLGVLIAMFFTSLRTTTDAARMVMANAYYEARLQYALDEVTRDLLETRPSLVTFYVYARDGLDHTAICFPTARDRNLNYVLRDATGQVSATPLWQGIIVYAYANGFVRRYADYTPRSYGSAINITSIDANQITLQDGTRFNLNGSETANQRIDTILDHARRFEATAGTPIMLTMEASVEVEQVRNHVFVITLNTGVVGRNNN